MSSAAFIVIFAIIFTLSNMRSFEETKQQITEDKEILEQRLAHVEQQIEEEQSVTWQTLIDEPFAPRSLAKQTEVTLGWNSQPNKPLTLNQLTNHPNLDFSESGLRVASYIDPCIIRVRQGSHNDVRLFYSVIFHQGVEGGFHAFLRGSDLEHGYHLRIGTEDNSIIQIWRNEGDDRVLLGQTEWTADPDTEYTVAFTIEGNKLSCEIDDDPMLSVHDPNVLSGRLFSHHGLFLHAADITLQNLQVQEPTLPLRQDLLSTADRYMQLGQYGLAIQMYADIVSTGDKPARVKHAEQQKEIAETMAALDRRLRGYDRTLQRQWGKNAYTLSLDRNGISLRIWDNTIRSLNALKGMGLREVVFRNAEQLRDINGLNGMPLEKLTISGAKFTNLNALAKSPLQTLNISNCKKLTDISALSKLSLINVSLNATGVSDFTPLSEHSELKKLSLANSAIDSLEIFNKCSLTELNIGGTLIQNLGVIDCSKLEHIILDGTPITDLTPLVQAPLKSFQAHDSLIRSLVPLQGKPLRICSLADLPDCYDVSPLFQSPLEHLTLHSLPITTISIPDTVPLRRLDMVNVPVLAIHELPRTSLRSLSIVDCVLLDSFEFLEPLTLHALDLRSTSFSDLSLIDVQRLSVLDLSYTEISDISPLEKAYHCYRLDLSASNVINLAPLSNSALKYLYVDQTNVTSLQPIALLPLLEISFNDCYELSRQDLEHTIGIWSANDSNNNFIYQAQKLIDQIEAQIPNTSDPSFIETE